MSIDFYQKKDILRHYFCEITYVDMGEDSWLQRNNLNIKVVYIHIKHTTK